MILMMMKKKWSSWALFPLLLLHPRQWRDQWRGSTKWGRHHFSRRPLKWWRTLQRTPLFHGTKLATVSSSGTRIASPPTSFPSTSSTTTSPASFASSTPMWGFRKVDPDRWEFANEGFLGGQRYLLKTIKRRRNAPQNIQQQGRGTSVELGQYGVDNEIDRLKRDRDILMTEIVKLRQQNQNSRDYVVSIEKRLQRNEKKQQQMMTFLARALKSPSFLEQLIQQKEWEKELSIGELGRKRRLPPSRSVENLQLEGQVDTNQVFGLEEESIEPEIETFFSSTTGDLCYQVQDQNTTVVLDIADPIVDPSWEELLIEGLAGRDETEGVELVDGSEVDSEVEELVAKMPDWDEDVFDLVNQMGKLESEPW
ncbi:hypothetical protein Syun_011729 [Stephania yunnanensis]|uniref:HSF-type DNA-binding domain-containing protein n=1 Tax=Stephania yunnanensis TaxID=152371 RepID=A0AAP0PGS9_9MAGN